MADENFEQPTRKDVVFDADQMAVIQSMIAEARSGNDSRRPDAISMYNLRDPKKIETVNVKRIDGKFVMGWKDFQKDAFKKKPQWLQYKLDGSRGGAPTREPFVTLLLQENEDDEITEKEMLLVDYVTEGKRDQYQAKVVSIDLKEVIESHGVLGGRGDYAGSIDEKGALESIPKILAETKHEERVFMVELPGFSKPVSFISDFLA